MSADRTAAERQRRRRAKQKTQRELQFTRADWALFLHPTRLAQKAGAPVRLLRRMALKELAGNAADVSDEVEVEQLDGDTYRIADRGPGLDWARVVELFAVNRPLTSSKLLRRPTRGAIGTACAWWSAPPSAPAASSPSRAAAGAGASASIGTPAKRRSSPKSRANASWARP
jgi:hypothetical protein